MWQSHKATDCFINCSVVHGEEVFGLRILIRGHLKIDGPVAICVLSNSVLYKCGKEIKIATTALNF